MIELILKPKGKPQRSVQLTPDQSLLVGRDQETVDIHLPEREVSRHQCRIGIQEGQVWVEPIESAGPVFVNRNVATGRQVVERDDYIAFGHYRVFLRYPHPTRVLSPAKRKLQTVVARLKKKFAASARASMPQRRTPTNDELVHLRRQAKRWDTLGRVPRYLLRGEACRRANRFELSPNEVGEDFDLVAKFIHESSASRRTSISKISLNTAILVCAVFGGVLTAHAITEEPKLEDLRFANVRKCNEAALAKVQVATRSGELLEAVQAVNRANDLHCGYQGADIEQHARELVRAQNHHVISSLESRTSHLALSPDERSVAAVIDGTVTIYIRGVTKPVVLDTPEVTALVWTPDGRLVAGSVDGRISMWEPHKPNVWQHIFDDIHNADIASLAVGREGNRFVSLDIEGEVRLWSLSGARKDRVIGRAKIAGAPRRALLDPAEQGLVVQTTSSVFTFPVDQQGLGRRELLRRVAKPVAIALAENGNTILVSDVNNRVQQFRRTRGGRWSHGRTIYTGSHPISLMSYSSRFDRTVVVDNSQVVLISSEINREQLPAAKLGQVSGNVHQLALTASERYVLTAGNDGADLWDVAGGTKATLVHIDAGASWEQLALSSNSDNVVSSVAQRDIRMWNLPPATGGSHVLSDRTTGLLSVQSSGEVLTIASSEEGPTPQTIVRTCTSEGFEQNRRVFGHSRNPSALALGPNRHALAVAFDSEISVWRLRHREQQPLVVKFHGSGSVHSLAFAGSNLIAVSSHEIAGWDVADDQLRRLGRWQEVGGTIKSLATTSDLVAVGLKTSGRENGELMVWKASHPKQAILSLKLPASVEQLAFSQDGLWLAAGASDGQVVVVNTRDREKSNSYSLEHGITALHVSSATGKPTVAAGDKQGTIALIPAQKTKASVLRTSEHHVMVTGVAFGGPGKNVVVASYANGDVIKWYAHTSAWRSVNLGVHGGPIGKAEAASGGDLVLTLSSSAEKAGSLQVWPVSPRMLWVHACQLVGDACVEAKWQRR